MINLKYCFAAFSFSILIFSCKSADVSTNEMSYAYVVLFDENTTPFEIDELNQFETKELKRTSRSQNLWQLKIITTKPEDEIRELLSDCPSILKLNKIENIAEEPTNSINSKNGKSKPIKN
ncbi:MAG: hypothetical protein ABJH98_03450 [Reichenbachiella sp.]|uniref:hypothetical protein n=1 Tax=Reichenbachiella sp. TaxID=2184521 RepID=UPI0032973F3E